MYKNQQQIKFENNIYYANMSFVHFTQGCISALSNLSIEKKNIYTIIYSISFYIFLWNKTSKSILLILLK